MNKPAPRRIGTFLTGHLVLAGILTLFCGWYLYDAWWAEASVPNLVLILPAGIAAVVIGVVLMLRELRAGEVTEAPPEGTVAMMLLLGAFVLLLPVIGFFAAIFLFIGSATWLMGLRNPVSLLLYAGLFSVVLVLALTQAVRLPDPMILEWLEAR